MSLFPLLTRAWKWGLVSVLMPIIGNSPKPSTHHLHTLLINTLSRGTPLLCPQFNMAAILSSTPGRSTMCQSRNGTFSMPEALTSRESGLQPLNGREWEWRRIRRPVREGVVMGRGRWGMWSSHGLESHVHSHVIWLVEREPPAGGVLGRAPLCSEHQWQSWCRRGSCYGIHWTRVMLSLHVGTITVRVRCFDCKGLCQLQT